MKCKNCGAHNDDKAQFCENCGNRLSHDLEEYDYESEVTHKSSSKKFLPILIILLIVLVAIASYIIYNINKNNKISRLENQLASETIDKNYKNMLDINLSLYELTKDDKYKQEIEKIQSLVDGQEQIQKANAYINNKEFAQAYKTILNLKNSKFKDQNQLDILTTDFQGNLTKFIKETNNSNDYDTSINVLNDLLAIESGNTFFSGLLDTTTNAQKSHQESVEVENKEEQANNSGKAYLGKTYYTKIDNANVRNGPSLSDPIIYKLDLGTSIYVKDYSVDERGVVWLYCEYGWISQKNISKNKTKSAKSAQNYIGSYLTVTVDNSNVREGPGLSYPVIDTLYSGLGVYVYDYSYDNRGVAWYLTDYGWISSKNVK